jgi:hypothetical protein
MCFHRRLRLLQLRWRQTGIHRQVDGRRQPELALAVGMRDRHMNPALLARKEEQPELAVSHDGGCHGPTLVDLAGSAQRDAVDSVIETGRPLVPTPVTGSFWRGAAVHASSRSCMVLVCWRCGLRVRAARLTLAQASIRLVI